MELVGPVEDAFPVAPCDPCGRLVLVYREPEAGEQTRYRCVHCDGDVLLDQSVPFEALETLGYGYITGEARSEGKCADGSPCPVSREAGAGGCGDGTCGDGGARDGGTGGCGDGGCGTGSSCG